MAGSDDDDSKMPPAGRRGTTPTTDSDVSLSGAPTLIERGRMYAKRVLAREQAKTLEAEADRNHTAADFLQSEKRLQEEIERNRHWKANINVIRDRVLDEFDEEDDERRIRRLERNKRLTELELEAAAAEDKLAEGKAKFARNQQRREAKPTEQPETPEGDPAEAAFRRDAEQILKYGAAGKYMGVAEEYRAKVIQERGGEENLTFEDKERIELVFELARRHQEGKN